MRILIPSCREKSVITRRVEENDGEVPREMLLKCGGLGRADDPLEFDCKGRFAEDVGKSYFMQLCRAPCYLQLSMCSESPN